MSLSQGEAYTFITHKQGRGKEGSLVASVKGTKSADIIAVLQKIPYHLREKVINTSAQTIQYNLDNILNFFNHRNTNTNVASFNSKIKLFRANLRGVTDTAFFLFRLKNLFA